MIDKQRAKMLTEEYLFNECHAYDDPENPIIINDVATLERPYGWIFFYDSRKSIEDNDPRYMIFGNCPIVIEKETGMMSFLGTALNLSEELEIFEMRRFGTTFELPEFLKNEPRVWD